MPHINTHLEYSMDKKQRIENLGIFFEKVGHPPMAGRVFAFLLLAEPPHADFYTIQEFLSASKSSISNALNMLMREGMVDYITFSGDRKRYFRVNASGWLDATKDKIRRSSQVSHLIEEVLNERSDTDYPAFNKDLRLVVDFLSFFSEEMERLTDRWEEQQQQKE